MRGPFALVRDSKARGGPYLLPGILVALALLMAVVAAFGVLVVVLLVVFG